MGGRGEEGGGVTPARVTQERLVHEGAWGTRERVWKGE